MVSWLKRLICFTALFVVLLSNGYAAESSADHGLRCVVLLHGLLRSASSMQKMADELSKVDYIVVNQDYATRNDSIEKLAVKVVPKAVQQCPYDSEIYFVTHSLGGILLRYYLQDHVIVGLKRAVMLGPPNQGSEAVDKLRDLPGFKWMNGEAGMQLGTGQDSVPNRIGAADFEVGIVAGNRTINLLLSLLIPGEDDGKVSVTRTRLSGMKDHIVLPVTHPLMMRNRRVIQQVKYFLRNGRFLVSE